MSQSEGPPKRNAGDLVHTATKVALGTIPIAGNAAAEFFHALLQPPIERRRDEWIQDLADRLKRLEEDGITVEKLQNSEEFISVLLDASQIAQRTHKAEKREALKNAVVNTAKACNVDDAERHMFLAFIDAFTEWHLRILIAMDSPVEVPGMSIGGPSHVLEHAIPELRGRRELYDLIWRDLFQKGLVLRDSLHITMSGSGLRQSSSTTFGKRFLAFINQ